MDSMLYTHVIVIKTKYFKMLLYMWHKAHFQVTKYFSNNWLNIVAKLCFRFKCDNNVIMRGKTYLSWYQDNITRAYQIVGESGVYSGQLHNNQHI